jgi:L-ascorbate metabolism protein UlaG (beta-lactamase superfamily)
MSRLVAAASLLALSACAASARGVPPGPPRAPSTVTVTYLGVAGWRLTDGTHVILVDPYYSRPRLDAPEGTPLVPDAAAIAARAPARADLVLVGHSHFDHALDVPAVALRTGAQVLGSESTARLARAGGVPADHVIAVKGGEDYQFDGFSVRVLPSLHSALDGKHTFAGATLVPADVKLPLPMSGYVEGGTFAYLVRLGGREIFISSTANFIERELEGLHPDVAIAGVGLREEIHDYSCRLVRVLDLPPLVVASHFDAWREPFDPSASSLAHLGDDERAGLGRFADEVHACAPAARVVIPEHDVPIPVP